jgi:hypothetical protein
LNLTQLPKHEKPIRRRTCPWLKGEIALQRGHFGHFHVCKIYFCKTYCI